MRYVYLSGTIQPEARYLDWRLYVQEKLADCDHVVTLSPVRGKDPTDWTSDGLGSKTQKLPYDGGGFVYRDLSDLGRVKDSRGCVLLNFQIIPDRQSVGTWTEFGMAVALGIPVIVNSAQPTIIRHPFVNRLSCRVTDDLDQAIEFVKFLLS